MKNVNLFLSLVFCVLWILSCGSNSITAGNGSETGNPIVHGTASLPSDYIADSLTLIVRKQSYAEDDSIYSYLGDEFDQFGQLRVPAKEFNFTLRDTGAFVVELRSGDVLAAVQYLTVSEDHTYELPQMILDTLKEITGTVKLFGGDNVNVAIHAQGIERAVVAQSDGTFTLKVPIGLITLKITPQSDQYKPMEILYVQAGTSIGLTKVLATEPVSEDYECDSLIIRAILDSNRLYTVNVNQVTVTKNNRIVEFDVAADSSQPELINISGLISVIPPVIGGLTALEELEIQYTSLTTLPEAIGKLVNLKDLELNNNNLTSLPESIINITPTGELRLSGNSLKLNAEQRIWADKYDPDWESNQQ